MKLKLLCAIQWREEASRRAAVMLYTFEFLISHLINRYSSWKPQSFRFYFTTIATTSTRKTLQALFNIMQNHPRALSFLSVNQLRSFCNENFSKWYSKRAQRRRRHQFFLLFLSIIFSLPSQSHSRLNEKVH